MKIKKINFRYTSDNNLSKFNKLLNLDINNFEWMYLIMDDNTIRERNTEEIFYNNEYQKLNSIVNKIFNKMIRIKKIDRLLNINNFSKLKLEKQTGILAETFTSTYKTICYTI